MSDLKREQNTVWRLETERVFKALGLSSRAARGLIRAGVLGPQALARSPWTDEEAGVRYVSLSWRLSVDPACDTKILAEVSRLRSQLSGQVAAHR